MLAKNSKNPQPVRVFQQEVFDQELVLGSTDSDSIARSNLDRCVLDIVNPRYVSLTHCRFRNCIFKPKKEVRAEWFDCTWENCVFHGTYISTHFGILNLLRDSNPRGDVIVKDCDYSQATMHGCAFCNTDVSSVVFPRWPCFTLLDPKRNFEKWKPTIFSIKDHLMSTWFANEGEQDAEVLHWPTLAQDYEIDADPEIVKRKLQSLDHVLL